MRVLITGNEGYIGSIASRELLRAGHDVVGLDTGYFMGGWLFNPPERQSPASVRKDTRDIESGDLEGFDAVVHMAELSNDPMSELDPRATRSVNYEGTLALARLARQAGVKRFVHMSSCSVYGVAEQATVDEGSSLRPQTVYAECKVLVEREVGALIDEGFAPVFLRNATAFGASPRMRFDLVLNNLAAMGWTRKSIMMVSDGTPWRPLVHVRDISAAIREVLAAPIEQITGQILNVGSSSQNYQVREIAEAVSRAMPDCDLSLGSPSGDQRSYRVSFAKIEAVLPQFRCEWDLERGVEELRRLCQAVSLDSATAEGRQYIRVRQLRHLLDTSQVDASLRWNAL